MSLCHETYRRCASVALVLAIVLIALPGLVNAQTLRSDDTVPKWEWFIGYQWVNPGGNIPDGSTPPLAVKAPSSARGAGTNVSYNFTKNLSLEGNYGGDSHSGTLRYKNKEFNIGPQATPRAQ